MHILHIVPDLDDPTNGIAVAAKLIARSQSADIIDTWQFFVATGLTVCDNIMQMR